MRPYSDCATSEGLLTWLYRLLLDLRAFLAGQSKKA